MIYLLVFFSDSFMVIFLFLVHLFLMLVIDRLLSLSESSCFLLLLFLECLVTSGIFKHALRVFISSGLYLLVVLIGLLLELLLELVLNFVLACLYLFDLTLDHQSLARYLLSQLLDLVFEVVGAGILIHSGVVRILCR